MIIMESIGRGRLSLGLQGRQ